ncbi:MAG: tripartite tricarboxylate transporter substrate binding protein [Synergistaceae bacterium]|jgi:tripartite-type tricarboxylate transporter receptor subunit TctC|nr:tripartite tricarboxylate transporter substrate binding protein [Synergistaceae bacterium]
MNKKNVLVIAGVLVIAVLFAFQVVSSKTEAPDDNWPNGVKLVMHVPYGAGGGGDTMVRQFLPYWEKELGTNIIIENRPGASGMVGTKVWMEQPKDGTHILFLCQLYLSGNILLQGADYKIDDFDVINFQQLDPVSICVTEDSPYQTIDDLIDAIRENPGKLTYGTIPGGHGQLAMEFLKDKLNLDFKLITYDAGAKYRTALLGKHVDFIAGNAAGDLSLKGAAKVLAVSDSERNSIWPDAPTFNEVLAKYDIEGFPPTGSSRAFSVSPTLKTEYPKRYQKLVDSYKNAYENPAYQEALKKSGEDSISHYYGAEESNKLNRELHQTMDAYKDKMTI